MLNRVPAIYRKEMLDMVRDRRTILSMVVVPVLSMPLLFLAMGKMITLVEKKADAEASTVAVRNVERLPGLLNALAGAKFAMLQRENLREAVEKKEAAVAVEPVQTDKGLTVKIYEDQSRPASGMAGGRVRTALDRLKEVSIKLKLRDYNAPDSILTPFTVASENIASSRRMSGFIVGGVLGYIVVLLMFSGGMYPAIDLTAGEKERRTLEVILSSPAGREELILGKILATTTAVFGTAVLTISSLVVSFRWIEFGKKGTEHLRKAIGNLPVDPGTMTMVIAALLPTAIMAASLMIAIALFAKSFKEAQSYLTPLVMAAIFPLIVGMMPGVQLTPALALVPLFNVCQLIKEIFQGEFSRTAFAITMVSNVVYAGAAFFGAVQVFKNEKVLFRT